MRGKFITLEGLDGAGKSTQLAWLAQFLQQHGISVRVTREPGGTALGEKLRELLLDPQQELNAETETLLMFAARREHLDKLIGPALESGDWVLCDRFSDASFAYQAGGSGVDWNKVQTLERWVHGGVQPDLTLYFDVRPDVARSRAAAVKIPDRYEQEQGAFHERVRAAYLRRAKESSGRIHIIDASHPIDSVQAAIEREVRALMRQVPLPLPSASA